MSGLSEAIQPAALLERLPAVDEAAVEADLRAAAASFRHKIVVLDDDPTGIQTVHGVKVYTDWSGESLAEGFAAPEPLFFILTNSRSFSAEKTRAVHRDIAGALARAAERSGKPYILISRSDSTLRGHYPLETETLRETLERESPIRFDGEILCPFFLEGNRFTISDIHYVRTGRELVPAGKTEFARDTTFSYVSSDLKDYCEEKTGGRYPASGVVSISLEELRSRDYSSIEAKLRSVTGFGKVIVNAAAYADVKAFAAAYLHVLGQGKQFLFRAAASLVKVLGQIEDQPLLTRADLISEGAAAGGLVIVGSHVQKTTLQLQALRQGCPKLAYICFDVSAARVDGGLAAESARAALAAETAIREGNTAVVYTSREVLRAEQLSGEKNLALSVRISDALTEVVALLRVRPAFVLAKGGITSSDVGVKALRVKRALVRGQIAPGVPVWETGEESRFPRIPYVIFPGNVGDEDTLCRVVRTLLGER